MAIYNLQRICEHRSDIEAWDASSKSRAAAHSLHIPKEYRRSLLDDNRSNREVRNVTKKAKEDSEKYFKNLTGTRNPAQINRLGPRMSEYTKRGKLLSDSVNRYSKKKFDLDEEQKQIIKKDRIERKLKESKAKQAKLKEAAQYILDVLDEQEYYNDYNEYDNSNDYYYYE